ncbi:MAG: methionine synthase [Actinomycetota bacterium]|nr:methionine synthase [Actinomycetota bacterium]
MTESSPTAALLPAGAATGQGPLPGTDIAEAVRTIAGELPVLPYLPELADRGVGADTVGRTLALLVDIHAEVVPSGWRICGRPGRDASRGTDFRAWDTDAAEQHLGAAPAIKLQLLGPWTLAARLELPNGHRAVSDHGATADLAASLGQGLRDYLDEFSSRLPTTTMVLQIDEPDLNLVLGGMLPTPSGYGTVRSVSIDTVQRGLTSFAAGIADNPLAISGVAPGSLWETLRGAGFRKLGCQLADLTGESTAVDAIGEAVEASAHLLVQLSAAGSLDTLGRRLFAGWRRIGFPPETLPQSVIPVAGPAPSDPTELAGVLAIARQLATALADPPESWS